MKYLAFCTLILACILLAGCTGTKVPAATPAPTAVLVTVIATTATPQPVFSLGDAYLDKPGGYTFNSEKDVVEESFRVDSKSWGIDYKIQPLNDNLQYCWFVMNVTNIDSGRTETFGYGREYSVELEQIVPLYQDGYYKITMKGQGVKVWVKAAKRTP